MKQNNAGNLVYITDLGLWFNKLTKKRITEDTAAEKLAEFDPKYKDKALAYSLLTALKSMGKPWDEIKPTSIKDIDEDALYAEAAPLIPFRYLNSDTGSRSTYLLDKQNVAVLVNDKADNALRNSFMSSKAEFDALKELHKNSSVLANAKPKPKFKAYLNEILQQYEMDYNKSITAEPKSISWLEDEIAFIKFREEMFVANDTPTWDQFLSRLDFPEVFMAWVWCLFEPTNNIRQVMWLRGDGNDGKSTVMNALINILGARYCAALQNDSENQTWFYYNVYGKRLVTYGDCKNVHLINSERVKSSTGGDYVQVEGKLINAFYGRINAKFLFASNPMPRLDLSDVSVTSRLIKLEVAPLAPDTERDNEFEKRLTAEGYAFATKCRQYAEKYLSKGKTDIVLPDALVERTKTDCASNDYNLVTDFIEKELEFGEGYYIKRTELLQHIEAFLSDNNEALTKHKSSYLIDILLNRVKSDKNVVAKRTPLPKSVGNFNIYLNMRKKGSHDSI